MWHGIAVSSSKVREAIELGDMRRARQLLGRCFEMIGTPAAGRGIGSRYVVPTINLAPYPELVPGRGVYITCLEVGGERFQAITNVGVRPTFGAESFAIESHILNFHPIDLEEDTVIRLSFLERLREERKWPSPEALKEQIGRDAARARRYFRLYDLLKTKELRTVE
jgi:riboflavin kinase/FMN adenylyltransferase